MLRTDTRQKSKTESNIHNDRAFVWFRMSLHKNLSLTEIGPIRQKLQINEEESQAPPNESHLILLKVNCAY